MAMAVFGDDVALLPAHPGAANGADANPQLDLAEARLLRGIHRGEDVRRRLSKTEREIVLPRLLRAGLIEPSSSGLRLGRDVARCLDFRMLVLAGRQR